MNDETTLGLFRECVIIQGKQIKELKTLLREAGENLHCDNRGATATKLCTCEGCNLRLEIQKVLKGDENE